MDNRQIRGIAIISKGDVPQAVSKDVYLVPSQSDESKKYKVTHKQLWKCSCPDFTKRRVECKHIHAIQFWLKIKNKVDLHDFDLEKELEKNACPYCHSDQFFKRGTRKTAVGIRQLYCCKQCRKRFTIEPIKHIKGNAKLVCLAMDCYFKGNSLRDIADTFKQFYNFSISHETIRRWINRFTEIMNKYTSKLRPQLGVVWHIDEQMIKSGKEWRYSWNMIDAETRFLIANNVTEGRGINDARALLQKAKQATKQKPRVFVTDGLSSYKKALVKEYDASQRYISKPLHFANAGIRSEATNNIIERYHNEFRDFDKVRRGFKKDQTAQQWNDNFRLYHNFIKPNMNLEDKTPSEVAGIILPQHNNRWLRLLKESLKATNVTTKENQ